MRVGLTMALLCALPLHAAAQGALAPDFTRALKSGDTVYVLDHALRETTGVFARLSETGLRLMVNGELQDIQMAEVKQISRRGGDPLWNGAIIGAALGGFAAGASTHDAGVAVGGAVVYGAIGALVDLAIPGRVIVYRGPGSKALTARPFAGEGERGLQVTFSF